MSLSLIGGSGIFKDGLKLKSCCFEGLAEEI